MFVVIGVRVKNAYCGNDECWNLVKNFPRELCLAKEDFEQALEEAGTDEDEIRSTYDDYFWDFVQLAKRAKYTQDLDLDWYYSCDEESAIFGVQIGDINDDGSNTLSEIVNSVKDEEVRVGKKLMEILDSWGVEDYMVETYLISDW